jgi:hypothetical protein
MLQGHPVERSGHALLPERVKLTLFFISFISNANGGIDGRCPIICGLKVD